MDWFIEEATQIKVLQAQFDSHLFLMPNHDGECKPLFSIDDIDWTLSRKY